LIIDHMTEWDKMWRKPFDDSSHYATEHLVEPQTASTTTTEYRANGKATVWHEDDASVGDQAWKEREPKAWVSAQTNLSQRHRCRSDAHEDQTSCDQSGDQPAAVLRSAHAAM